MTHLAGFYLLSQQEPVVIYPVVFPACLLVGRMERQKQGGDKSQLCGEEQLGKGNNSPSHRWILQQIHAKVPLQNLDDLDLCPSLCVNNSKFQLVAIQFSN